MSSNIRKTMMHDDDIALLIVSSIALVLLALNII